MQGLKNDNQPTPDKVEEQILLLIEKLTLEQLYEINGLVVNRINYLEKVRDLQAASVFRRGNKVSWERNGEEYLGTVYKVNQKTILVFENDPPYRQWKISPQFLTKIN